MSDSHTKYDEINSNENRSKLNEAIENVVIGKEIAEGILRSPQQSFIDLNQQQKQAEEFWRTQAKLNNMKETVDHPKHYGGGDNPYEAIKVIEAWDLGFNLGNTLKYIARKGKKDEIIQELEKAAWYLNREISNLKNK
jgi:hypothetical protein